MRRRYLRAARAEPQSPGDNWASVDLLRTAASTTAVTFRGSQTRVHVPAALTTVPVIEAAAEASSPESLMPDFPVEPEIHRRVHPGTHLPMTDVNARGDASPRLSSARRRAATP